MPIQLLLPSTGCIKDTYAKAEPTNARLWDRAGAQNHARYNHITLWQASANSINQSELMGSSASRHRRKLLAHIKTLDTHLSSFRRYSANLYEFEYICFDVPGGFSFVVVGDGDIDEYHR